MRTEKKELTVQIGKRLQTVRENSGYTQEAFAEALDIGVEHYRKIELGMYGFEYYYGVRTDIGNNVYMNQPVIQRWVVTKEAFTVIQNMLAYNLEQVADAKVFYF